VNAPVPAIAPPEVPAGPPEHSITMLGAPTSGKTTFLAALQIALQKMNGPDRWKLIGDDAASTQALVTMTNALAKDHTFPPATPLAIETYKWLLVGPVWKKVRRFWWFKKRIKKIIKISLNFADASGGLFGPASSSMAQRDRLLETLVRCRGLIFIFDPVGEFKGGDAHYYLAGVLAELAQRAAKEEDFDGFLPQNIAVCISKFDELRVLGTAERLDILDRDPDDEYGFPRILDSDSREFFIRLCQAFDSSDPQLVLNTIETYFRPDRVKFFVTSAIGFYVDPATNQYNSQDIQNQVPKSAQGPAIIRGNINPINVVEPLMWLTQQIQGDDVR
jgi:hypothetical protein